MAVLALALFIVAAILFAVATFGIGRPRVELVALGLCIGTIGLIVQSWPGA